jgi:hypothetical protein
MTSLIRAAGKLKANALKLLDAITAGTAVTVSGAAVDILELDGDIWFFGNLGVSGGTGSAIMKVQTAIDSAFTTPVDVTGAVTAASSATVGQALNVVVDKAALSRFVRYVITVTGTTVQAGQLYAIAVKKEI